MKMRLDELLVERGYFDNLHDAQASIMAGEVVLEEHRAESAGMRVDSQVRVRMKAGKDRGGFVSRGGLKLQRALDVFDFDVTGLDCTDLGASSGGFTDCLLSRGAAHVSAVDVNVGQFDWGLRNDERVSLYERTNIRDVSATDIGGPFDLAVADLSFISLRVVMGNVASFLKDGASFVSLLKPQFEVAKSEVGAGGIVSDPHLHERSIAQVLECAREHGFDIQAITYSPVTGRTGNIEFLFWAKYDPSEVQTKGSIDGDCIKHVVEEAHARLGGNK